MQKRKIAGVAAVIALGLSAGGAYTASNTVPTTTAGYGSAAISGASVTSINYTYSADMATITAAKLVFTADQSANTVKAGFNTATPVTCTKDTVDTSGATFDCAFSPAQDVTAADTFNVSVS